MDPTPASAAPPVIGTAVVEFVRTQRQQVASLLLGLGAALLILTVWLGFKAMKPGAPPADAPLAETNPLDPTAPPKPAEVVNPKRGDYLVGGVAAMAGFLVFATAGAALMVALPKPGEEQQRTDARRLLLLVGGSVGLILILAGVAFFYRWSESLTAWLDKERTDTKQAWKVLVPMLMIALGAGVTFFSILPARADERHSTAIRRTVYGANLGLTVLLLLTALVIGNVIVAMRVPNKLDVTAAAITTISDPTKQLIGRLAEPITIYHVAEADRFANDTRALLDRMQEVNPSKLRIVPVSPVTDTRKYRELAAKYPAMLQAAAQQGGLGVLLTTGPDEKRHAFIREDELTSEEPIDGGRGRKLVFLGESKIARELAFLGESDKKTVMYVTQGGGELSLGGGGEERAGLDRSMNTLKGYLEKSNLDVRPLTFDAVNPVVPPDADMVMVADPKSPFPPAAVAAIDKYMSTPRGEKGDKKGKLLVLGGARNGPDGKIVKSGLEPLLERFGVGVQDRVVMFQRTQQFDFFETVAVPLDTPNPITELFQQGIGPWSQVRPLVPAQLPPGGPLQVSPLFVSQLRRPSWLEEGVPVEAARAYSETFGSPEVAKRKNLVASPRILAAAVSEKGPPGAPGQPPSVPVPRVVVYGASDFASDAQTRLKAGDTSVGVVLISATADWLRERENIAPGEGTKTYATYKLSPTADDTRLVLLPLGMALLIVIGLGAGVWVIRRT